MKRMGLERLLESGIMVLEIYFGSDLRRILFGKSLLIFFNLSFRLF